jgi:hypothetical protein
MTCPNCLWYHTNFEAAWNCVHPGGYDPTDTPKQRPVSMLNGKTIQPIFRDGAIGIKVGGRANKPGRPRVPLEQQQEKARERSRKYRSKTL